MAKEKNTQKGKINLDVNGLRNEINASGKKGFREKTLLKLANKYEELSNEIDNPTELTKEEKEKIEKKKKFLDETIKIVLAVLVGVTLEIVWKWLAGEL